MIRIAIWKGRVIAANEDPHDLFEHACSYFKTNYPGEEITEIMKEVDFTGYKDVEALFKANVLP